MPTASPGRARNTPSTFPQILSGAPADSSQSIVCFSFRHKRFLAYISGRQLNVFSAPNVLVQCLLFPDNLVAVAADTASGRLAIATKKAAWVSVPVTEGWTKVWWDKTLLLCADAAGDDTRTLSWGINDELLVGGSKYISLFSTLPRSGPSTSPSLASEGSLETRRPLWSIPLSSPARHATLSPSGSLIATCGTYDRLVKIWRRLSYEEGLFDYMYIPHPGTVTSLQWRPPREAMDDLEDDLLVTKQDDDLDTLYTIATDGVLRVWKPAAGHDLGILSLYTTIDLVSAVPDSPILNSKGASPLQHRTARFTCVLPSEQFSAAVDIAIRLQDVTNQHASEHLKEVVSKDPDVVFCFDGRGRMSAWGLQSVGHKRRPGTPNATLAPAFHITHAENLPVRVPEGTNAIFEAWLEGSVVNLVAHHSCGEARWWREESAKLFSPATAASVQLSEVAYFSGHVDGPVRTLAASSASRTLLSSSATNEIVLFDSTGSGVLHQRSRYSITNDLVDAALLVCDDPAELYSLNLEQGLSRASGSVGITLRDCRGREIDKVSEAIQHDQETENWRLSLSNGTPTSKRRAVILNRSGKGYTCVVSAPNRALGSVVGFSILAVDPGDPVLHATAVMDTADTDRFGVVALTRSGDILISHIEVVNDCQPEPILIATFPSGVDEAESLASNNNFAAIASSKEVVIVNLTDGYVEHKHRSGSTVGHVAMKAEDNLVAIANDSSIDVLAQGRIGYREDMPPWVRIKHISVVGLGLTINAVTWMSDGSLAVAAGSCIFSSSNLVDVDDLAADVRQATGVEADLPQTLNLSTVAERMHRPVPVWHPTLLAHIVRLGKWSLSASLSGRLLQKLRFWSEGDVLQPLLDVPPSQIYGAEEVHDEWELDRDTINELTRLLHEKKLPDLSESEQQRLILVLEAMMFCAEHVKGLDNLALRYLYSWKFEILLMEVGHASEPNGELEAGSKIMVPEMHWREVAFAFHSTSQQPLLDLLIAYYDNKITWTIAKRLGLFAWLSDKQALEQILEALAQTVYRSSSPPDPINASLYFLALHKKQTLLGLWRIATWHKEQRATMNFLRRDFSQGINQTAAKKNAYALMGKRRFEYAAAFFLLADDGPSALNVLASQCGDVMLAIAVGRLYSGNTSPSMRKLLHDRLIPLAKKDNDRWLLTWCFSLLGELDAAAHVLIRPLHGVRDWHQDDPALLNLYQRLRKVNSEYEFDAVLRAARILRRMGLWLVALDLVSQWTFTHPKTSHAVERIPQETAPNGAPTEGPSLLDEYEATSTIASPVQTSAVADESMSRQAKAAELLKQIKAKKEKSAASVLDEKRAEPTQFKEPDANTLLDNFGF